jgi:hypothetical protein
VEEFTDLACSAPYSSILRKISKPESFTDEELHDHVFKACREAIIMKLPGSCGLTLKSLKIIIKPFRVLEVKKAATFLVFLHELGHLLQRINCKTFLESSVSKSQELPEKEGGYQVEADIFGSRLFYVTEDAGNYLLKREYPGELLSFQEEFNRLNEVQHGVRFEMLKGSRKVTWLSKCGTVFENYGAMTMQE